MSTSTTLAREQQHPGPTSAGDSTFTVLELDSNLMGQPLPAFNHEEGRVFSTIKNGL